MEVDDFCEKNFGGGYTLRAVRASAAPLAPLQNGSTFGRLMYAVDVQRVAIIKHLFHYRYGFRKIQFLAVFSLGRSNCLCISCLGCFSRYFLLTFSLLVACQFLCFVCLCACQSLVCHAICVAAVPIPPGVRLDGFGIHPLRGGGAARWWLT